MTDYEEILSLRKQLDNVKAKLKASEAQLDRAMKDHVCSVCESTLSYRFNGGNPAWFVIERKESYPVRQEEGKWWFYDETWSNRYGPYETEVEARAGLTKYAETL